MSWGRQCRDKEGNFILWVVSPFGGDEVTIRFRCPKCSEWVYAETILAEPYFLGDNLADSYRSCDTEGTCQSCNEDYEIEVENGIGGMLIDIPDVKFEDIYFTTGSLNPYGTFIENTKQIVVISKLKITDQQKKILNKMLFIHLITSLEAYLFDSFINQIKDFDGCYEKFIKNYIASRKRKIVKAEKKVRTKSSTLDFLSKQTFLNIERVNKYYIWAFGIGIEDMYDDIPIKIGKLVQTRHILVHKNGKKSDGRKIIIHSDYLHRIIPQVIKFVDIIEARLKIIRGDP